LRTLGSKFRRHKFEKPSGFDVVLSGSFAFDIYVGKKLRR
jgi:hypothetical protein